MPVKRNEFAKISKFFGNFTFLVQVMAFPRCYQNTVNQEIKKMRKSYLNFCFKMKYKIATIIVKLNTDEIDTLIALKNMSFY